MTVEYELVGGIGKITFDDGKANVLSTNTFKLLNEALDKSEADKTITLITGREGIFSAGFDLKQLNESPESAFEILQSGAALCLRLLSFPYPVISVCNGHAYPMGAFILMSSDYRIGTEGDFKIGMNEVRINITVPKFAIEVARGRLQPAFFNRTAITGELFSPADAVKAGFIDEAVEPSELMSRALTKAKAFKEINYIHHHAVKLRVRSQWIAAIKAAIADELTIENLRDVFGRR